MESRMGEMDLVNTTKAVIELGELAMRFGRTDRTCVAHPDGTPESDTDHTVMLAWIAPALADVINDRAGYERYPIGKVTQYAVVHDAPEVYAGDTPTIRITPEEYAAKEKRESEASWKLWQQFYTRLPWFARTCRTYEVQTDPVARFVRSVDKIMPKIVHVINAGEDLFRASMSEQEFRTLYARQRLQVVEWCPEPLLLQLYDELCGEILRHYGVAGATHMMVVQSGKARLRGHHGDCLMHCEAQDVFDKWVEWNTLPLNDGEYPVEVDPDGSLVFNGKQED